VPHTGGGATCGGRALGRLEAVAALVPPGHRVADIGTDHGRLPRYLLGSGRVPHCIASERDRRSLAGFTGFPRGHALAPRLEVRVGNGLDVLRPDDRVETVVLAGLGARAIIRLLRGDRIERLGVRRLVLQPQTETGRLRRWLAETGRAIVAERLARERGRFYEVMAGESAPDREAIPRHPRLRAEELYEVGPLLVDSGEALVRRLWAERVRQLEQIRERSSPGSLRIRERLDRARRILAELDRATP
jgi:tRNA (adenine22-N1)-methyltransferase